MAFPHDGKKFVKGAPSPNPLGGPRKTFATVNADLKSKGITPLSKTDFIEAMTLIMNSDKEALELIVKDDKTPMALRIMIQEMANPKFAAKAIQDYRNWLFGSSDVDQEKPTHITLNIVGNSDTLKSDTIK